VHGQWLVSDEADGRTVAVVYDGERDARRIEAAPRLVVALRTLVEASTTAYKDGRIPAEPYVAARNLLADLDRETR
jgi:hypothetical protein